MTPSDKLIYGKCNLRSDSLRLDLSLQFTQILFAHFSHKVLQTRRRRKKKHEENSGAFRHSDEHVSQFTWNISFDRQLLAIRAIFIRSSLDVVYYFCSTVNETFHILIIWTDSRTIDESNLNVSLFISKSIWMGCCWQWLV